MSGDDDRKPERRRDDPQAVPSDSAMARVRRACEAAAIEPGLTPAERRAFAATARLARLIPWRVRRRK